MFNHERGQKILEMLKRSHSVRVTELSGIFNVSEATVRRDLDRLQEQGKVKRVHGGVILAEQAAPEPPVLLRASEQAEEKERIGQAAARMVYEGDTIFIGSGTTTEAMARNLRGANNITVITNSLRVINILAQQEQISVIATGGLMRVSELSFISHLVGQALQELRPNKVFMGIRAISLAGGLTNDYIPEVSTDRIIIRSAPEVILLADHTKFGKVSTAFVAPLTAVHKIITDSGTPSSFISALRENNIEIIVVQDPTVLVEVSFPEFSMRPRDKVLASINHQEPDHVPLDIGGTDVTGIHISTYRALLPSLGFEVPQEIPVLDVVQQIADIDEQILKRLNAHCRSIFPNTSSNWQLNILNDHRSWWFTDEWGISWQKSKDGGLYFDIQSHPLAEIALEDIPRYKWPDPFDPHRREGLVEIAKNLHEEGEYAVILSGITGGGPMEVSAWLSGFENFFVKLLTEPQIACALLDKVLEIKLNYWRVILPEIGEYVDVISESEDLGMQDRLLVSPKTFRQYIKPRLKQLIGGIKESAPHVKVMLHSDGAIFEILPDLIEIGVDILNPVQVSAKGMGDTALLKREFGSDLVFWGGIDTQNVLPFHNVREVKEEVKRRLDDLAPGGGYVMASVHNIQANTPPENVMAMWEAWSEYGAY